MQHITMKEPSSALMKTNAGEYILYSFDDPVVLHRRIGYEGTWLLLVDDEPHGSVTSAAIASYLAMQNPDTRVHTITGSAMRMFAKAA